MKRLFYTSLFLALPTLSHAQTTAEVPAAPGALARIAPSTGAFRTETAPRVDGRLDDPIWAEATIITGFTQRDPDEGQPVSERTEVWIAYDAEALYVAARMADRSGVTSRLGRRDMALTSSDWFRVSLDSYHDRRTAVRFDVNPSGVRRDATLTAGGGIGGGTGGFAGADGDLAWDPVWEAETTISANEWTAEIRIPFSQLRFSPADEQTWGLQLERIISRRQELALYSFTPKSEPGGVPAFADLTELRGIRPGRPLELLPYVLGQAEFSDAGDNPFRTDRETEANAGLDARYRVTSNVILSATINPDFGQVEVDPAIINLSAFETRLEEKRPFFVEGSANFRFGGNVQGPGANGAALLYSRRIGRAPQLGLRGQSDAPGVTDILGAAKISGKTAGGLSLGLLDAVTSEENGRFVDTDGATQRGLVEPLANYLTGRVNQEFRRGQSALGAIVTAVHRDLSDDAAAAVLRESAYTGGIDFVHEWANRSWALGGYVAGSHVTGSEAAILAAQRSSTRYYQRPDSDELDVDPNATSLRGLASTIQLRKPSGAHWTGDLWVGMITPGFEINDAGFLTRADGYLTGGMLRYSERQPGKLLRNWSANVSQNHTMNFDGDWIQKIVRGGLAFTHLSYWDLSVSGSYSADQMDDRFTRGGPIAAKPAAWSASAGIGSDPRKSIVGSVDISTSGSESGSSTRGLTTSLDVRTSPQWNLSFGPRISRSSVDAQYVTAVADPLMTSTFGTRYVFAPLEQTELSLVTRLNYTFTPDLSLEMYLQPLISNGDYGTPKEFQRPSEYDFAIYGRDVGTIAKSGNRYTVDPDGVGPAASFNVTDRSFTTRSLRGNAVLRWEYRPGSTLYVVWQQERLNPEVMSDFQIDRAFGGFFEGDGNNVLVLKWNYWFNP